MPDGSSKKGIMEKGGGDTLKELVDTGVQGLAEVGHRRAATGHHVGLGHLAGVVFLEGIHTKNGK